MGGGIDSHGFFRLIHSTCIFAYHELSLRSMLILDQTVQKGDITKGGGGRGAAYSVRSRCILNFQMIVLQIGKLSSDNTI